MVLHAVAIAVCFLVLIGSGGLANAADVRLDVTPKEIDLFATKAFTLNCTYQPDPTSTKKTSLISLVLSKVHDSGSSGLEALSSVNGKGLLQQFGPTHSPDVQFAGNAQAQGVSHVSGTWSTILVDLVGTYVCEANVMDEVGHISTFQTQASVSETTNSLAGFLQEVKTMQKDLLIQQECCHNMSAEIAEIQTWRTSIESSLSLMEKTFLMFKPSAEFKNRTYYASKHAVDGESTGEAVCDILGGYLAEVDDNDELLFIRSYMENTTATYHYFFIAGRDDLIEGKWFWPRNQQAVTFLPWGVAQPSPVATNVEDCLEVAITPTPTTPWTFNDIPCSITRRNGFLCEVPIVSF